MTGAGLPAWDLLLHELGLRPWLEVGPSRLSPPPPASFEALLESARSLPPEAFDTLDRLLASSRESEAAVRLTVREAAAFFEFVHALQLALEAGEAGLAAGLSVDIDLTDHQNFSVRLAYRFSRLRHFASFCGAAARILTEIPI